MRLLLRAFLSLTLTISASALIAKPVADPLQMSVSASSIQWSFPGPYDRLMLTIGGPDGFSLTKEFEIGRLATIRLNDLGGKPEGTYTWELRVVPRISDEIKQQLAAARKLDDDAAISRIQAETHLDQEIVHSGGFMILGGAFVIGNQEAHVPAGPKAAATGLKPAPNDVVTPDDEIIQGSLCVGLDCVNNESFNFDTIRLKENNTRITFLDTSTASGFPNNVWTLTANDSCSGCLNKFSVDDVTGAKTPFTVLAGAPTNSLFVSSSGKVGFGNASPALHIHVTATDTPAIRQEQTSGGGFTAQTWDIGANEANWFVRDLTAGSHLPFRIRPGAPTSSIDIAANGNVGIGTASPAVRLDLRTSNVAGDVYQAIGADPAAGPSFNFGYSGATFGRSSGFFNIRPDASATPPNPSLRFMVANTQYMMIDNQGYLGLGAGLTDPAFPIHHANGAYLSVGGVWTNASSREFKEDITALSAAEASCALEELKPVKFAYKADLTEHHVGFIAEDVPALLASQDHKGLSAMDIVAVLAKVVQEQQAAIQELSRRVEELEKKN